MTELLLSALVVILIMMIPICLISLVRYITLVKWQFKYSSTNPFTRECKKCGQIQDAYSSCASCKDTWWEDMGTIKDETCNCHKYAKQ